MNHIANKLLDDEYRLDKRAPDLRKLRDVIGQRSKEMVKETAMHTRFGLKAVSNKRCVPIVAERWPG